MTVKRLPLNRKLGSSWRKSPLLTLLTVPKVRGCYRRKNRLSSNGEKLCPNGVWFALTGEVRRIAWIIRLCLNLIYKTPYDKSHSWCCRIVDSMACELKFGQFVLNEWND